MDKLDKAEPAEVESASQISPMETIESANSAVVSDTTTTTASSAPHQRHHRPRKSVEGWIVFATGLPAEAESDDIERVFAEYGNIHSLHLNVDRRTGYLKGYALVEYDDFNSAQNAIHALNNSQILEQKIKVDWCFLDIKPVN